MVGANNLHQMALGFLMYAGDHDDQMAPGLRSFVAFGAAVPHNYYRDPSGGPSPGSVNAVNLYSVAVQYGFLPSTDIPVVNSGQWVAPNDWAMVSPHWYFPGYVPAVGIPSPGSPLHLSQASGDNLINSDLILFLTGTTYAVQVHSGVMQYNIGGHPNYNAYLTTLSEVAGAYGSYYDASVRWTRQSELTGSRCHASITTYLIYHPPQP